MGEGAEVPLRFVASQVPGQTERVLNAEPLRGCGGRGMKKGFVAEIEDETERNKDFRRVLYTGRSLQLVLMSLKPGEAIGEEVHEDVDQFFRFEEGTGAMFIDGVKHPVEDGTAVIVPSCARHNVVNTSRTEDLKLYTLYSPPEHKDKIVRRTKAEAESSPEEYDGHPTE